jgi:hypothetical protein
MIIEAWTHYQRCLRACSNRHLAYRRVADSRGGGAADATAVDIVRALDAAPRWRRRRRGRGTE